jgi:uncharacterized protein YkwD
VAHRKPAAARAVALLLAAAALAGGGLPVAQAGALDARPYGSSGAMALHAPVVGIEATPTGKGYWRVAADGGVFTAGDARYYGSTGAMRLNRPIVGMAATPDGGGYWLVASDGGVFSFGNARFRGSTGAMRLNRPIVGMAATPNGRGYWLVASDGGIFSFGNARFYGSTGAIRLYQPIVGMAAAPDGRGYLLAAADGGIFRFGAAKYYGSAGAACKTAAAVGITTSPNALGYWLTFADARTYAFSPSKRAPRCAPSSGTRAEAAALDLFNRLNAERAARGLAPLAWDGSLAVYAANWSRQMAASGFRHSDISQLLTSGRFGLVGENIAWGKGAGMTAGVLHVAWMKSDGHRKNMLLPGFQVVGIGVYCAPDGTMWATQNFARLASSGPAGSSGTPPTYPIVRSENGSATC